MIIQPDLFTSKEELERLDVAHRLDKLEESQHKGMRSQFAKLSDCLKRMAFLEDQLNILDMTCVKK